MTTAKSGAIISTVASNRRKTCNEKIKKAVKVDIMTKEQKKQTTTNANATTQQPLPTVATEKATPQHPATIITADNIELLSEIIALRALKTNYANSGMPFMYNLYCGLVKDINENKKTAQPFSDGYDIASEIKLYLFKHIGNKTTDENTDGEKNKDGTTADIWRTAFRIANRYIMGERKKVYKCAYVDEIDENGNRLYYEIPQFWDVPTITDYKTITAIIKQLKLTDTEKKVLYYRLRGIGVDSQQDGKTKQIKKGISTRTIAEKVGISSTAVYKHLKNIQRKAVEIGLTPKTKSE